MKEQTQSKNDNLILYSNQDYLLLTAAINASLPGKNASLESEIGHMTFEVLLIHRIHIHLESSSAIHNNRFLRVV